MNKAVELVAKAVLGMEDMQVIVGGKTYRISPPTIRTIASVGNALSSLDVDKDTESVLDVFMNLKEIGQAAEALSYLIEGNDSLTERFKDCPMTEVVGALCQGFEMIDVRNFTALLGLTKSVQSLIATPRH